MNKEINKVYGNKVRVRVCGIYIDDDSILLIRHKGLGKKGELWSPPGGGINYMEDAKSALVREFSEETNLKISVGDFLFVNEYRREPLHAIELFFKVSVTGGSLALGSDPEHSNNEQLIKEVRFVTFKELAVIDNEKLHNVLQNINEQESILNMRGYFHFSP